MVEAGARKPATRPTATGRLLTVSIVRRCSHLFSQHALSAWVPVWSASLAIARKYREDITFERFAPGVKVVLELPLAEGTVQEIQPLQRLTG